jgi:pimeloyl-ACP methyl ester carboxylesterase/ketosteroid isomerase-like protein
MQWNLYLTCAFFLAASIAGGNAMRSRSDANQSVDPLVASLGEGFVSGHAKVKDTTLHYVRGGAGPAVVLLHGFPQDWYEFHQIMPRLAKKFTVVAVDLRGMGGSTPTAGGYDAATMAGDIHELAEQLHLQPVYVVGHDLGGMVAYAFARRYPEMTRGAMILDVPLAGIGPWEEIQTLPQVWHIRFHQTPDLPEKLIAGRQAIYFRYFLRAPQFSDADLAHYAESYATTEKLRSIFEFYRAFPEDARFNAAQRSATSVPLFLAAGERSPFSKYIPRIAEALREQGWTKVQTGVVRNSSHYVADEQPEIVADLIERYATESNVQGAFESEYAITALRRAYAAFNQGDIDTAVEPLDAKVEWSEPPEFPGGGTYQGREGAKQYLAQSRAAWAEVISEPIQFIPAGNRIVVFVHARVRPKDSSQWQEVDLADVYTFRAGKAIAMRAFANREEALLWAGAGKQDH